MNQGVTSVDRIDRSYEVNGSLGGPVVRDRVWFFYTGHRRIRDRVVLDSFYRDGSPGIDDRQVHGNNLRFTIQATRNNKLSVWYDRNNKLTGHNHTAGEDVETVSESRGLGKHGPRYAAQAKWTSTISSRMLSEVGWSTNRIDYNNGPQPGLRHDRPGGVRTCLMTPCLDFDPNQVGDLDPWYSVVSRFDPEAIGIERIGNAEFDFGKVAAALRALGQALVRHRLAQLQGGRPEQLRAGGLDLDQQRRHPEPGLPLGRSRGDPDLQYAAHLQPPPQPRHRPVRPGLLDARPADAQPGDSPGVVQRTGRRERVTGRTLGAGPAVRRDHEPAELVRRLAALRPGLRPVRRRPDGAEVQRGPVHGGDDGRLHRQLQPAEPNLGVPRLAGLLPRRPGRQLLHWAPTRTAPTATTSCRTGRSARASPTSARGGPTTPTRTSGGRTTCGRTSPSTTS